MAEDTQNGAVAATTDAPAGPSFSVEKIYVKDVSFEVPGAPMVFTEQAQPQLQLNLNQRVQRLGDNSFEVVLGVTLTCNANDKPLYLAEVQQAGVFTCAASSRRPWTRCSASSARTCCTPTRASW